MVKLDDPERCSECTEKARVVGRQRARTKTGIVYWWRRHECRTCIDPKTGELRRWSSSQSLVDLHRIAFRKAANPNL